MERLICFPRILFGFLFIAIIHSCFGYGESNIVCHERERTALLRFKQGLINSTNRLSSWVAEEDCCKWEAVGCDNTTGHVIKLDLRNPYSNYRTHDGYDNYTVSMLSAIAAIPFSFCYGESNVVCHESEKKALPRFKQGLEDPANRLSSWVADEGCCKWEAVGCDNYLDLSGTKNLPAGLVSIENLNLSSISDLVPNSFWNFTSQLSSLNLSNNQLQGDLINILLKSDLIDLSSNLFNSHLPRVAPDVAVLILSKNSFSGSLLALLCESMDGNGLTILDLSENLLSGQLPQCWMYWQSLAIVNLGSNNLIGNIPSSMGSLHSLESLRLQNNNFSGDLPLPLQSCTNLRIIDLGENMLDGRKAEKYNHSLVTIK
ncbi:hypothetical protein L1049_021600 [Liquidambar formosana]|uniref:Leucine-rich repeat-containing N-terminal plant-type domain-containing protein n=1 Tax=Liquidambar formosana TaxID=63359 RepID=A0AAP0N2S4_LIQFO